MDPQDIGASVVAAVVGLFVWRRWRAVARLEQSVAALGFKSEGGVLTGSYGGVAVSLEMRGQYDTSWMSVGLGSDWPASVQLRRQSAFDFREDFDLGDADLNSRVRCLTTDPADAGPVLRHSATHGALRALFAARPDARVENSDLILTQGRIKSERRLRQLLESGSRAALDLSAAARIARRDERALVEQWRVGCEGLHLDGNTIQGCYQDVDLRLDRIGTVYRARLSAPLGPDLPEGLRIRRREAGLSKLLEEESVETGNPELDATLHIKTGNPGRLRSLLKRDSFRHALSCLFERHPEARIEVAELTLELAAWCPPLADLRRHLDETVAFVHQVQELTEWPEKREAARRRREAR